MSTKLRAQNRRQQQKKQKTKIYSMQRMSNDTAEIMVYGDISDYWGEVSSSEFKRELDRLGNVNNLTIRINSNGGSVTSGWAIYNVLKQHKAFKTVYVDGIAASMGAFIAMAGDEILMSNAGLLMIHKPWGIAMGEAEELRQEADTLDKMFNIAVKIHAERTGTSEDEVREMMTKTTYLDAEEALELGFIDEIIEYDGEDTELDTDSNMLHIAGEKLSIEKLLNKKELMQKISEIGFMKQKNIKSSNEGDEKLMNLQELKEKYPDIHKQAKDEGVAEERARIQAIEESALPGTEEMVQKMKFTEPKSAVEATQEIVKAFKKAPQTSSGVQQVANTTVPGVEGEQQSQVLAGVQKGQEFLQQRALETAQGQVSQVNGQGAELSKEEKSKNRAERIAKKMEGKVRR